MKKNKKFYFQTNYFIIILLIILSACQSNSGRNLKPNTENVEDFEININRYEKDLFNIDTNQIKQSLKSLQKIYPEFLGVNLDDSSNINQLYNYITDPALIHQFDYSQKIYPNLGIIEKELFQSFKYIKYYFPEFNIPKIYSYISGLQYEFPIHYNHEILIIGLDLYLGSDFNGYRAIGLPDYKIQRMQSDYISIDCIKEISQQFINAPINTSTFLEEIIYKAKVLYFMDATLVEKADCLKIGYTEEQLNWCFENEENLWSFIIEKNILYSADYELIRKLTTDGPFTAAFTQQSPARLGIWIGWQIIRSYMNHNPNISLHELFMEKKAREILDNSRYKPKKK